MLIHIYIYIYNHILSCNPVISYINKNIMLNSCTQTLILAAFSWSHFALRDTIITAVQTNRLGVKSTLVNAPKQGKNKKLLR